MRRRLFNLAAAVSLVLFLATCVMWVRSYHNWDSVHYCTEINRASDQTYYACHSDEGTISFHLAFLSKAAVSWAPWAAGFRVETRPVVDPVTAERYLKSIAHDGVYRFGFGFVRRPILGGGDLSAVFVPHWCIALVCAVGLVPQLVVSQRDRVRRHHKRCPTCGYDLRATPARCPECGTAPPAPREPATTAPAR